MSEKYKGIVKHGEEFVAFYLGSHLFELKAGTYKEEKEMGSRFYRMTLPHEGSSIILKKDYKDWLFSAEGCGIIIEALELKGYVYKVINDVPLDVGEIRPRISFKKDGKKYLGIHDCQKKAIVYTALSIITMEQEDADNVA